MCNNRLWALVATGLLACSSDQPPGARIALDVDLPADSDLAHMQNVSLLAAGDGFTLAGYENGVVRWARMSRDGVLTDETGFPLDAPALGPYFAATKKSAPGDQLITIVLNPSATTSGGYDLQAIVQDQGATTPAAPVVLTTLVTGTDKSTVQIAAAAAVSGNLGFVVWGTKVQGKPIEYLLLGADAVTAKSGTALSDSPDQQPAWDCLATTNGPTGMGFAVITPDSTFPQNSDWNTFDINEAGNQSPATYAFTTAITDCRIVASPTSDGGYDFAFKNVPGIGVAFYYPPAANQDFGIVTPYPLAVPAATFGSPANVPRPAWAAPAGGDVTVGLASSSGVRVVRFTYQGIPHGSALVLRSVRGKIGPVAAWVGSDLTYVTYADLVTGVDGTPSVQRYFTEVEAPAQLP